MNPADGGRGVGLQEGAGDAGLDRLDGLVQRRDVGLAIRLHLRERGGLIQFTRYKLVCNDSTINIIPSM